MSKIKLIVSAVAILLVGITAGWIMKPSGTASLVDGHDDHTTMQMNDTEESSEEIWTCSMHPQIRQNEPGICAICEMDLIPLDNSMGSDDPTVLMMSEEATKLAQVETTIVGKRNAVNNGKTTEIKTEGTVEIDEQSIKAQSSHIGGRVEEVNVTFEGEYVKAGQKIATIYSTDLLAASQELITAAKFENKISGIKSASTQKLKNWRISEAQINAILAEGKPIETIDIYAEESGYVLEKKVSLGDYVKQGQTLYTIGSLNNLWLQFNVYESDLANVKIGQTIAFKTPSTGDAVFQSKISYIEPLLNNDTRTAIVRSNFRNRGNQLKPGMLLSGIINATPSLSPSLEKIVVPSSAVLWTGKTSVVYVKQQDTEVPSFQYREVVIGDQSGGMISILDGLNNGEEIVTNGAFAIDAAAQLNNNNSMMNRNVSIKKEAKRDIIPDFTENTPQEFKEQLDEVAEIYIDLKDALVNTDPTVASSVAKKLGEQLGNVDMSLVKDEAHMYWMEQLGVMEQHGEMIVTSTEVEYQRKQFEFVSKAVIASVQSFGTSGKTYFVQFCPMAFNNKGADWLSSEEQIKNPYFGDKMMKCGSVKRRLSSDFTRN